MFTGIVQEVGAVRGIEPRATGVRLEFDAAAVLEDAGVGDSIAVDGCCLTVVGRGDGWFAVEAVARTLAPRTFAIWTAKLPTPPEPP